MKLILLYGDLGARFGKVHEYDVRTPAEAVRALCATISGFKEYVINSQYYRVVVGGKSDLSAEETFYPVSDKETIRIIPLVSGANGFGKVLIGAALVGFSLAMPGFGAFTLAGQSLSVASIAGSIGFSLVLGGASQMLFSQNIKGSDSAERPENRPSFIFNGAVNTSREGNCVPVCYGRMIVGSQVISAGLSVEQI